MSLVEWLGDGAVLAWWQQHPVYGLSLAALLGWLVAPLLWRVVVLLPLRLQLSWRAAAQQELGLVVEPLPSGKASWRQTRVKACSDRWWRLGFCALSGLALGVVVWRFGVGWPALWGGLFSLWLLVMAAIDARTLLLPDALTLSCLWLGLVFHSCMGQQEALAAGVWGVILGYGVLWLMAGLFRRLTAQDGMGHGDFKLFAALGAWLGWQTLPWVLFVAASLGVLWALVSGRLNRGAIPFGPSLALAGWLLWLWGPIY